MKQQHIHFILGIVLGALVTGAFYAYTNDSRDSGLSENEQYITEYYGSEVATLVSPHSIRERMDKGDDSFILVDVRAKSDYEREHVIGAINIDTSEALETTLAAFQALPEDKQIIIYCYSTSCMNGRKAGNFLAQNGVYVQEMTIGWNEWRYAWEMWNYETEWETHKVEDYVVSGPEPGTPKVLEEHERGGCPVGGSLSC